jgi:hypothetical protein
MKVTYQHFGNVIVITADGHTFTISRDDKRFNVVDKMIRESALEAAALAADPNGGYRKVVDRVLASIGKISLLSGG